MPSSPNYWFCPLCQQRQPIQHLCSKCLQIYETCCGRRQVCFNAYNNFGNLIECGICAECRDSDKENRTKNRDKCTQTTPSVQLPPPQIAVNETIAATSDQSNPVIIEESRTPIFDVRSQIPGTDNPSNSRPASRELINLPCMTRPASGGLIRFFFENSPSPDEKFQISREDLISNRGYGTYGDEEYGWIRIINDDEVIREFDYLIHDRNRIRDMRTTPHPQQSVPQEPENDPSNEPKPSTSTGVEAPNTSTPPVDLMPGPDLVYGDNSDDDEMTPEDREVARITKRMEREKQRRLAARDKSKKERKELRKEWKEKERKQEEAKKLAKSRKPTGQSSKVSPKKKMKLGDSASPEKSSDDGDVDDDSD